jgi:hypothetical protein
MTTSQDRKQKNNKFYEAWRKIRWDPEISDPVFRLLSEIADCIGNDSETYISNTALASRLNCSTRTIKRQIKILNDKKIIAIRFSRRRTRRHISLRGDIALSPPTQRGDKSVPGGVTPVSKRGDTALSPYRTHRTIPIRPGNFKNEISGKTTKKDGDVPDEVWLKRRYEETKQKKIGKFET